MKQIKLTLIFLLLLSAMAGICKPPPPPSAPSTWTGATSTDWFDAGNWVGNVPDGNTDAQIPNTTRKPKVSFDLTNFGVASVRNISFNTGASITIDGGCALALSGSWSAPATLITVQGDGVVNPSGTGSFGPYFNITGYTSFNNLFINDNYQVGTASTDKIDIRGRLNLGSGDLITNDKVVLKSTATYTAYIAQDGGSITGRITMERYVSTGGGYHHLSSPVTDATVASWAGSFPIVGLDGARSGIVSTRGSLDEYREAANTNNNLDSGYYNYTGLSRPLNQGIGYTARIPSARVVKTFGTPNLGSFTVTVTKTAGRTAARGWNFLGNPYPAPISWSAIFNETVGHLSSVAYVWKSNGSSYAGTWVALDGINRDTIPSSQGFFVYSEDPSVDVNFFFGGATVTALNPRFYKTSARSNEFKLRISGTEEGVSELTAFTTSGATDDFDVRFDGMLPPAMGGIISPTISYRIKGANYLIHATGEINANTEMPLDINLPQAGTYSISASSISLTDYPVYILDKATGIYYDLGKQNLTIASQGHEDINGRYSVVFSKSNNAALSHAATVYSTSGTIVVERDAYDTESAQVTVTDMLGRQIASTTMTGARLDLPMTEQNQIYVVTVRSAGSETVSKICTK